MGDVRDFRNFMGAVIDKRAFEKIGEYQDDAKKNAKVLAGGGRDGAQHVGVRTSGREHRLQVLLPVEHQLLVHAPVEVRGDLRNAQQRPGGHQHLLAGAADQSSGQAELAVEPRVGQGAPVDLETGLLPAGGGGRRPRLEHEARGIGVRPDDAEGR